MLQRRHFLSFLAPCTVQCHIKLQLAFWPRTNGYKNGNKFINVDSNSNSNSSGSEAKRTAEKIACKFFINISTCNLVADIGNATNSDEIGFFNKFECQRVPAKKQVHCRKGTQGSQPSASTYKIYTSHKHISGETTKAFIKSTANQQPVNFLPLRIRAT